MASQDFVDLMRKLHIERYSLHSKKTEYNGMSTEPSLKVIVVLEKEGNKISIQSSEWDFIKYVTELRSVADVTGEHKFTRIKDLNKYNADVEHLIDEDRSKFNSAVKEIQSGKFTLEYIPSKLIGEFLGSKKGIKNVEFLPLKNDYYHILADSLLVSKAMLDARKAIIKNYPETKKVADLVEIIFLKSFRPTGNALKNYKFYTKYVNFDMADLGKRMSAQLIVANDTMKDFAKRKKIDTDIGIPKMMDIYGRFFEILAPMINLIRIGLELKRGNSSPEPIYGVSENIRILKSDPDCSVIFSCLDEQIRHSDAHASIRIDKETGKVFLIDARSGKEKIVRVYTFGELVDMINTMQNEFFPVIYPTLVLVDIAMLDLLLVSREYKHLLLALGNC